MNREQRLRYQEERELMGELNEVIRNRKKKEFTNKAMKKYDKWVKKDNKRNAKIYNNIYAKHLENSKGIMDESIWNTMPNWNIDNTIPSSSIRNIQEIDGKLVIVYEENGELVLHVSELNIEDKIVEIPNDDKKEFTVKRNNKKD